MNVQELQKVIDEKRLDPTKLSQDQASVIDKAFKDGTLKGYKGVGELARERLQGREELAKKIEQEESTVPGISTPIGQVLTDRTGFQTTGEVVGTFIPYLMDRQKLINAFTANPAKRFGPNYANEFPKATNKFSKVLMNLPLVKRFGLAGRLFGRTVGLLENTAAKVKDSFKLGLTQATQTEIKSIGGGALGAAAGSLAFDAVNSLDKDLAKEISYDLADVSNKVINENFSPEDRVTAYAAEAAKDSLMWGGGMTAMFQLGGIMAKAFAKGLTGTKGDDAKRIGDLAAEKGIPLNVGQLAKEKEGLGAFSKTYFETIGILPLVSSKAKGLREQSEKQVAGAMFKFAQDFAPVTTSQILGYQMIDVLNNNYRQFQNLIDTKFEALANRARGFGNPAIIPTAQLRKNAAEVFADIDEQSIKRLNLEEDPVLRKSSIKNNPMMALYLKFADSGVFDDKTYLTPLEFLGLKRQVNQTAKDAPNNKAAITAATQMRSAMDYDLGSVGMKDVQDDIMQNSAGIKKLINENEAAIANAADPATARQNFINELTNKVADFGDGVNDAFQFYSVVTQPFESMTAKELQKFGDYLFTAKSLFGIPGKMTQYPSRMFDDVIFKTLQTGTPEAVNELRFLVGATDKGAAKKTGEKFMQRLGSRFLYDSFFKAFEKQPDEAKAVAMTTINKLQEQGMLRTTYADEILQKAGVTPDILQQRKAKGLETIEGDIGRLDKFIEKDIPDADLGSFLGVDQVKKNLGLLNQKGQVDPQGRLKLETVFGGGERGKKQVKLIDDFLDIIDTYYSQNVGDSSKYLTRRVGLTGVSQFGAGAALGGIGVGMGGGLGALIITPLLLRGFGGLLADPKYARALLDLYTPEERLAKLGKGSVKDFPFIDPLQPAGKYLSPPKRRALGILFNYFADDEEEKVDPLKLNAEQITTYLQSKMTKIPDTTFNTDLLPPNLKKRMFPEVYLYENSSFEDKKKYDEITKGAIQALATNDAIEDADNEVAAQSMVNLDEMVRQPQTQQMPEATMQQPPAANMSSLQTTNPLTYQALFPNDPTGQMLTQRGQNART